MKKIIFLFILILIPLVRAECDLSSWMPAQYSEEENVYIVNMDGVTWGVTDTVVDGGFMRNVARIEPIIPTDEDPVLSDEEALNLARQFLDRNKNVLEVGSYKNFLVQETVDKAVFFDVKILVDSELCEGESSLDSGGSIIVNKARAINSIVFTYASGNDDVFSSPMTPGAGSPDAGGAGAGAGGGGFGALPQDEVNNQEISNVDEEDKGITENVQEKIQEFFQAKKSNLWIVIVIIVLLGIGTFFIVLSTRKKKPKKEVKEEVVKKEVQEEEKYKMIQCDKCKGRGYLDLNPNVCKNCNGTGYITQAKSPFDLSKTKEKCRVCKGTGNIIKHYCNKCNGTGFIKVKI